MSGAITREDILLAHWKLNETEGTTTADASANEKDGILKNMDDASWVPGKFGNALSFDGTDDFVDLPLDIPISSAKGTVSMWVKTAEDFADHTMVYYGSSVTGGDGFGSQNEFHIAFRNNEKMHLFVRGTNVTIASEQKYNDGKWHQVVATSDRANKKYSLYVDGGAWKKSITDKQPKSFALNKVHRLGKPSTNKRYYKGLIDDVRLYSEPFTEEEVVLIYGDGFSDFDRTPVISLTGENPLQVNINTDFTDPGATAADHEDGDLGVLEGKFPEENLIDTSKLGRWTLTYTATDSAGNTVTATRDVDVVDPSSPVITLLGDNPIALEAGTDFTDPGVTVTDADGNPIENPDVQVEGLVDATKPGTQTLTYTFTDAESHAAIPVTREVNVVDTTPPVIILNGEPEVTLLIGQDFTDPGTTITDNVEGDIQAVVKLQLSDVGLDAHWPLDQVDDQLITPDTTGQYPGTIAGTDANALVPGIFGKALNLDGTDDVVTATDYKGITGGGIRTMSAWIKTDKTNAAILNWGENAQGKRWTFRTHSNKSIRIEVNGGGVVGTTNITDNKWHHVAAVFPTTDGQLGSTLFYIDGKLEVNSATSTRKVNSASTQDVRIGTDFSNRWFRGMVDDVRIYNRALSAEELRMSPEVLDTGSAGTHTLLYMAVDAAGNQAFATRTVVVKPDPSTPIISLVGEDEITVEVGLPFEDPGVTITDGAGNPVDGEVQVASDLDPENPAFGEHLITYSFTDTSGNISLPVTRTVNVEDTIGPTITLNGINPIIGILGQPYTDPGATAHDLADGPRPVGIDFATFPGEGLVSRWRFDEDSGNQAHDSIGNNHLTFTGATGRTGGILGGAITMNNNGTAQINDNASLDITDTITLSTWFHPTANPASYAKLLCKSRSTNGKYPYALDFNQDKKTRFYLSGPAGNISVAAAETPPINQWNHVIGTWDGKDAKLFVNNVLQEATGVLDAPLSSNNLIYSVGGRNATSSRFTGHIDEIAIWNRALTDNEAANVYLSATGIDTSTAGEKTVYYSSSDTRGHTTSITRTINVVDPASIPAITLVGENPLVHAAHAEFTDPGATVADPEGNALDATTIVVTGAINVEKPGQYSLFYDYKDANGLQAATVIRTVQVKDQGPPTITLVGENPLKHQLGFSFTDPGATGSDLVDGDVAVNSDVLATNRLKHNGFHTNDQTDLILEGNGGLLQASPRGETLLTTGPGNAGLYFNGDAQFRASGAGINKNDNYQNLFTGHFNAKVEGTYEFGTENPDDFSTVWLDLNQNGVFEQNGSDGNEWLNGGNKGGYKSVDLKPGFYRIAITHHENKGGSNIDARFTTPEGGGPTTRTRIHPADPAQNGLWVQYNPLDVSQPGEKTVTYTTTDAAGNTATLVRTVIIENNPDAPILKLKGERNIEHPAGVGFTDPGVTITDLDGNELDTAPLVVDGTINTSVAGEYTLTYNYTGANGLPASPVTRNVKVIDNDGPVITLTGKETLTLKVGDTFIDPGATAIDALDGEVAIFDTNSLTSEGLILHLDASRLGSLQDGAKVSLWPDISGDGNHLNDVRGNPTFREESINKLPAVSFDGYSFMATTRWLGKTYTVITVSRQTGSKNGRLISSKSDDWSLGYRGEVEDVMYAESYVSVQNGPAATTNPHLYTAVGVKQNELYFYADGKNLTVKSIQNRNLGYFQLGGFLESNNASTGEVSEVLLYNRALSDTERISAETHLNAKYSLQGYSGNVSVNTALPGTYHVIYFADDSVGNRTVATRTIVVETDPDAPVITLIGKDSIDHEAGTPFTDPGFTIADKDGNALDASQVQINGSVSENTLPGQHTITYDYFKDGTLPLTESAARSIAQALGLELGGVGFEFAGDFAQKGLYAYKLGEYAGKAYFGTGGTEEEMLAPIVDDNKYRPNVEGENALQATRMVNVSDTRAPVITLNGDAVIKIAIDEAFTDPGATAADAFNGETHVLSSNTHNKNGLFHYGYKINNGKDTLLNFENDGGLFKQTAAGQGILTTGPSNRGLDFANDGHFKSVNVGIDQNNNYQNLITGFFRAPAEGTYRFGIGSEDDAASFWFDLDKDGAFSASGEKGNELLFTNYRTGNKTLDLTAGLYRIAIGHREGAGASRLRAYFWKAAGNSPSIRVVPKPSAPSQDGLWVHAAAQPVVDTSQAGEYTVTYEASDISGNHANVTRKVIVVADPTLPFIALKGAYELQHEAGTPFTDPGATVDDKDGNVIEANLTAEGDVEVNTPGQYVLTYNFSDGEANAAEAVERKVMVSDTTAPSIILNGDATINLIVDDTYTDTGATAQDQLDGNLSTESTLLPSGIGLVAHYKFDETEGKTAKDSAGNHDATLVNMNGDEWSDGKVDGALLLNGTEQHLTIEPFEYGGPITISIWTQWKQFSNWARIIGFGNAPDDNIINITRNTTNLTQFSVYQGGVNQTHRVDNIWTIDQWVHTAVSADAQGVSKIYRDGEQVYRNPNGITPAVDSRKNLYIGRSNWDNNPYFNGLVDDLRLYNRTLSDEEVRTLHSGQRIIDTSNIGEHTITYSVQDVSGNLATATRTVVVKHDPEAPILTQLGEAEITLEAGLPFDDPGVTITDGTGRPIEGAEPTIDPIPNLNTLGTQVITYSYAYPEGKAGLPVNRTIHVVDTTTPTITLTGGDTITVQLGTIWEEAGVTANDNLDGDLVATSVSDQPGYKYGPGLTKGTLAGSENFTESNPGNHGIDPLGPMDSELNAGGVWAGNTTIVYTGQFHDQDGKVSFYENIDDIAWLSINGEVLFNNNEWNVPSQATIELDNGGWLNFELRMGNGGGGGGPAVEGQTGFGFDPTGKASSTNHADYQHPRNTDEQTADFFRTQIPNHDKFDAKILGEFKVVYSASDSSGNTTTVTRTILVEDDLTLPVLTLNGDAEIAYEIGTAFTDPGATVADRRGNALDATKIIVTGQVNTGAAGEYVLSYDFTDDKGAKAATIKRMVTIADTLPPVITLNGETEVRIIAGTEYTDAGATVTDNLDGDITVQVTNNLPLPPPEPLHSWSFDEGQGDTAEDASKNAALAATLSAGAEWGDGFKGKALSFPGNGAKATIDAYPGFSGKSSTTLALRVKQSTNSLEQYALWQDGAILLEFGDSIRKPGGQNLRLRWNLEDEWRNSHSVEDALDIGIWHHWTFTYDNGTSKIYRDGQQVYIGSDNRTALSTAANALIIGTRDEKSFNGSVDELQVYDKALSDREVTGLYYESTSSTSTIGEYTFTYTAMDQAGNTASTTRKVIIVDDIVPPVITLVGEATVTINVGDTYEDAGATAEDNKDGSLTPFIDEDGTVDAVDTSKAGTYIVTYNVSDLAGNKAVQVTRTIIVKETITDKFEQWLTDAGLAALPAEQQTAEADPDNDGLSNLLEYALGGKPTEAERTASILPSLDTSSGTLSITFVRLKVSEDDSLTFEAQLTTTLSGSWDTASVNITGALQGVDQANLPDGKDFAESKYERIRATAKTTIAAEVAGKQFLRIQFTR